MPKISVIIPAYNCAQYLGEALDSVERQTLKDVEILVVDDGSTDHTEQVIRPYCQRLGQRFVYLRQENRGPGAARNLGILKATAEYLAFLDADDYYSPRFLEDCLDCLENNVCDVVTPRCYAKEYRRESGERQLVEIVREDFPRSPIDFYSALYEKYIGSQAMLVRKVCFEKAGLYDEKNYVEDWDIWLRFAGIGLKADVVPGHTPLWIYRVNGDGRWSNPENEIKRLKGHLETIEKHKATAFSISPACRQSYAQHLWDIGKRLLAVSPNKALGLWLMLKSQFYDFQWGRIQAVLNKTVTKLRHRK